MQGILSKPYSNAYALIIYRKKYCTVLKLVSDYILYTFDIVIQYIQCSCFDHACAIFSMETTYRHHFSSHGWFSFARQTEIVSLLSHFSYDAEKLSFFKELDNIFFLPHGLWILISETRFKQWMFVQEAIFEVIPDTQQGAGTHVSSNKGI